MKNKGKKQRNGIKIAAIQLYLEYRLNKILCAFKCSHQEHQQQLVGCETNSESKWSNQLIAFYYVKINRFVNYMKINAVWCVHVVSQESRMRPAQYDK